MNKFKRPRNFNPRDFNPGLPQDKLYRVLSLALDVSGNCNLACRYCAESATQPKRNPMTSATLKRAMKFLHTENIRGNLSIRLGSGEPLLNLPLLKELGEIVNKKNRENQDCRIDVHLTTNGTLIDKDVINWLVSSGWFVKISIDGPAVIHNRTRVTKSGKGTYKKIAKATKILAEKLGSRFSTTSVICKGHDPSKVFKGMESLGVKRIELVPVSSFDPEFIPCDEDLEAYENFVMTYGRRFMRNKNYSRIPSLIRFESCVRKYMGYNVSQVACGAGRSFFGVDADGSLYPCFRFIGIEGFKLGDIRKGLDESKLKKFRISAGKPYSHRRFCRACWAAPLCGGPCFAVTEMFGPGYNEPDPIQCEYILADAHAAVWFVNKLRKVDPERLLAFLPGTAGLDL
jgi:uncharacterized protein